jgi:hypothetical protein
VIWLTFLQQRDQETVFIRYSPRRIAAHAARGIPEKGERSIATVDLRGRITEDGALEIRLPAGLPPGDMLVRLQIPDHEAGPEVPRTDEEVQALMSRPPIPPDEFLAWRSATPPDEPWGDLASGNDRAKAAAKEV